MNKEADKSKELLGIPEITWASIAEQGRRWEMEDAHVIIPSYRKNPKEFFAAVYDGHGGRDLADFAKRKLHVRLARYLKRASDAEDAIRSSFLDIDSDIDHNNIQGGAAAVIAYLDLPNLYVGNSGDARAVLDRAGNAERLSNDHKPQDPKETLRIEKAGGKVVYDYWGADVPRVNGFSLSRALGDKRASGGLIIADPYISKTKLNSNDRWLILACDGLWDVVSDKKAVEIVHKAKNAEEAVKSLRDQAFKRGTRDNVSIVVLKFN